MLGKNILPSPGVQTISAYPSVKGTYTYSGSPQTLQLNNYDSQFVLLTGELEATNAGDHYATVTPQPGYMWPDGTTRAITLKWTIERAAIAVPTQKGTLTHNGKAQTVTWTSTAGMTITGTQSATNAGTYKPTATPDANHKWTDGTTGAKTLSWTIGKAAGSLSVDKTTITLNNATPTAKINITQVGDGALSVTSSNPGIVAATLDGKTINVGGGD